MHVLIVEDNSEIATNIGTYLEAKDHTVDFAADGLTGLHLAVTNNYNVIILDLMLPGMNGLEVCRKLRESSLEHTPILMLTARDTLEDVVEGFEAGTDDYLIKPFSLQELEVRLEALHRRASGQYDNPVLSIEDLEVNLETHKVKRANNIIKLKPTTMRVLVYMMRNTHRVVTRQELETEIWGDSPPDGDPLRAHIYNIRNSLDKPFDKKLVHTVHGIGYRISSSDE
ncbi:MAG: response regulator transcription factor [Gammaproteobacteria bacterium]|nr:response regulator transcription factor [Gammaproteobacteria bacterium]